MYLWTLDLWVPQLWLRFSLWVLPALKNSSPYWPYRTQDKAIRRKGWILISIEFVWGQDFRDHISLEAAAFCADGQSQQQCAATGFEESLNRKNLLSCEVWPNENDSFMPLLLFSGEPDLVLSINVGVRHL